MDRRTFLSSVGAVIVAGGSRSLISQCVAVSPGVLGCREGLKSHFPIVTQDCPERCWAASMAGIFAYNDHPIDQDVIARVIFGTLACIPAGTTKVLNAVLNRNWIDRSGDKFSATITGLYDPLNGINTLDNDDIVSAMKEDSPLLYCNKTHAMVIVGLDYRKDGNGNLIAVDKVHMADPYPGKGYHVLSPVEMVPLQLGGAMTYLASVDVGDA